jgi:hypothetical protein
MCQSVGVEHHLKEASVSQVITIGLDVAKSSFHAHGVDESGETVFSSTLSRGKLLDFFASPTWIRKLRAAPAKMRLPVG